MRKTKLATAKVLAKSHFKADPNLKQVNLLQIRIGLEMRFRKNLRRGQLGLSHIRTHSSLIYRDGSCSCRPFDPKRSSDPKSSPSLWLSFVASPTAAPGRSHPHPA